MRVRPVGRTAFFASLSVAFAGTSAGCTSTRTEVIEVVPADVQDRPLRSATNLPGGFIVLTPSTAPGGCPPRLRDGGLDATLTLVQALNVPQPDSAGPAYRWTGDYAVDRIEAYGGSDGDGLRVDCSRLRPLGLVRLDSTP